MLYFIDAWGMKKTAAMDQRFVIVLHNGMHWYKKISHLFPKMWIFIDQKAFVPWFLFVGALRMSGWDMVSDGGGDLQCLAQA